MKRLLCLIFAALMVAGCAGTVPSDWGDGFAVTDQQCREYAREMVGEADDEGRYRECLALNGY